MNSDHAMVSLIFFGIICIIITIGMVIYYNDKLMLDKGYIYIPQQYAHWELPKAERDK